MSQPTGLLPLSLVMQAEARIPKVEAVCYVCRVNKFVTYQGVPTEPPDPASIYNRCQVKPVATCSSPYCRMMEMKRQDAVFLMVIAPEVDRYFTQREARWRMENKQNESPPYSDDKEK